MTERLHDVVIVGGRPAGASLAARLGAAGLDVAIVDKAEFPSVPEVPSSPIIYPGVIPMLEDIGVTEDRYAHASIKIDKFVMDFEGYFRSVFVLPVVAGRDYAYGIDRADFDHVLWTNLERFDNVTAIQGFKVEQLLRDEGGRVSGVVGRSRDGATTELRARLCVVGADGRHSLVARRLGANIVEDFELRSTVYQALWRGVPNAVEADYSTVRLTTRARGQAILMFPSAKGLTWVIVHTRSDRVAIDGDAQRYYRSQLDQYPSIVKALSTAEQTSPVRGIKQVANRYLEHGGPGWVLVGDAVHAKDPIDGQGIFDALIETQHLAELLIAHARGQLDWDATLAGWRSKLYEATHPMFIGTTKRLRDEIFGEPPEKIVNSVIRWLMTDPTFKHQFMSNLCRLVPGDSWQRPTLVLGALGRGLLRDISGRSDRRPPPS